MARRKNLEVSYSTLDMLQKNVERLKKEYAQRGIKTQIEVSEYTTLDNVWLITVWGL